MLGDDVGHLHLPHGLDEVEGRFGQSIGSPSFILYQTPWSILLGPGAEAVHCIDGLLDLDPVADGGRSIHIAVVDGFARGALHRVQRAGGTSLRPGLDWVLDGPDIPRILLQIKKDLHVGLGHPSCTGASRRMNEAADSAFGLR